MEVSGCWWGSVGVGESDVGGSVDVSGCRWVSVGVGGCQWVLVGVCGGYFGLLLYILEADDEDDAIEEVPKYVTSNMFLFCS